MSLLVSVGGGLLAGTIFKKTWQFAAREDEAPKATDAARGWHEILIAAALQGAIFATVKATVDRLTAAGTHSLTGTWPGEDSSGRSRKKRKEGLTMAEPDTVHEASVQQRGRRAAEEAASQTGGPPRTSRPNSAAARGWPRAGGPFGSSRTTSYRTGRRG